MTRLLLALAVAYLLVLVPTPGLADAFTLGVHDQGADPATVATVAGELGTRTVRIVATPDSPHTALVRDYADRGLTVQAAILIKRDTTVGAIRSTIRAWAGHVRTVSIGNEPELNGVPACTYARLFARAVAMIRREFPGITIGFGEFSPAGSFEYVQRLARCHRRIRADFTAVHPYQFFSDPLSAPTEKSGVGRWMGLGSLGAMKHALRAAHLPTRLRATEFSYLISGPYRITPVKAALLWPRAVKQARRWTEQLIVYGLGQVHDTSSWGSAALLDRFGRATPALAALAKALGRVLPAPTEPPPAPAGDLVTPLPDGTEHRDQPLAITPATAASTPDPDPQGAEGAQVEDPTVVPEPGNSEGTDAPADPPPPVSDGPTPATGDGPAGVAPDAPAEQATS